MFSPGFFPFWRVPPNLLIAGMFCLGNGPFSNKGSFALLKDAVLGMWSRSTQHAIRGERCQ
eukprot:279171-Amphidinium_carterae.1